MGGTGSRGDLKLLSVEQATQQGHCTLSRAKRKPAEREPKGAQIKRAFFCGVGRLTCPPKFLPPRGGVPVQRFGRLTL
jgi:hypothetical protein